MPRKKAVIRCEKARRAKGRSSYATGVGFESGKLFEREECYAYGLAE